MSLTRRQLIDRIESEFAPRFAKTASVLKTAEKSNRHRLEEIGISAISESILPDVILDDPERGWLFLMDAASPRRHMTQDRQAALRAQFKSSSRHLVLFSAFSDSESYGRCAESIDFGTHVWIADAPDHMIHFNGERFLGPYSTP